MTASNLEREETSRYLHMLYQLQLRPLAEACGRETEAAAARREATRDDMTP